MFYILYNCDALKADDSFSKNEFTNTSCARFWTEYLDTTSILSHAAHILQQNKVHLFSMTYKPSIFSAFLVVITTNGNNILSYMTITLD